MPVVKSTGYSSIGSRFYSQHQCGGSSTLYQCAGKIPMHIRKYFLYVCVFVHAPMKGSTKAVDLLELELQAFMSHLT